MGARLHAHQGKICRVADHRGQATSSHGLGPPPSFGRNLFDTIDAHHHNNQETASNTAMTSSCKELPGA